MTRRRLRVGIIGLHAGQSWAARAHLPALRLLADTFEIVGVANASYASSQAAVSAAGIPRAFSGVAELVASADVDIVTVTVKVPNHLELVKAAVEAGKHVYCEWPLGNGLQEAEALAAHARRKGVVAVAGTQARVAPEIQFLRKLLADGFVGDVLSTTINAWGNGWGAVIESEGQAYVLDQSKGATMLSIPIGHTLAALREVLGDVSEVAAVLANRRTETKALDTGKVLPKTTPDQVLISALLASGAPLSLHYRGGRPRGGPGFVWEINGTRGDVRITGPFGHAQLVQLTLEGATGDETSLRALEVPDAFREGIAEPNVVLGNVARMYARMAADVHGGSRTAPTFDDAVELHRVLAAVEASAAGGQRLAVAGR